MHTSSRLVHRPGRLLPAYILELCLIVSVIGAILGDRLVVKIDRARYTGAPLTKTDRALATWLGWITVEPLDEELPPEFENSPTRSMPSFPTSPMTPIETELPSYPESMPQPVLTDS